MVWCVVRWFGDVRLKLPITEEKNERGRERERERNTKKQETE